MEARQVDSIGLYVVALFVLLVAMWSMRDTMDLEFMMIALFSIGACLWLIFHVLMSGKREGKRAEELVEWGREHGFGFRPKNRDLVRRYGKSYLFDGVAELRVLEETPAFYAHSSLEKKVKWGEEDRVYLTFFDSAFNNLGQSSQTTLALDSPYRFPKTFIASKSHGFVEGVLNMLGAGPAIEVESDEFSRRFSLNSQDHQFAKEILNSANAELFVNQGQNIMADINSHFILFARATGRKHEQSTPQMAKLSTLAMTELMDFAKAFWENIPTQVLDKYRTVKRKEVEDGGG